MSSLLMLPAAAERQGDRGGAGAVAVANLLPNGSFEFWEHLGERALGHKRNWNHLWTADPELPKRWHVELTQPCSLGRGTDSRSGESALALAAPGERTARIRMDRIEILPGTECTIGFWLKGKGEATMAVHGLAIEGHQRLAEVRGTADVEWREHSTRFTMPHHMRSVTIYLTAGNDSDVLIDDAYLNVAAQEPFDAGSVLGEKYGRDEHTLFYEDFDGPAPSFNSTSPEVDVTGPEGGRFGRGLRLHPSGSASLPLNLDHMPEEGTLELWISPDSNETGRDYLSLMKDRALLRFGHWTGDISCNSDYPAIKEAWTLGGSFQEVDVWRMREGQWHHLAFTWDRHTLRFYFNGALCDMKTLDAVKWPDVPSFIQLSHALLRRRRISGIIDEIRLSNIRRYGPVVPPGLSYSPPLRLPSADSSAVATKAGKPGPDLEKVAQQRKELLGTIAPTRPGEFENTPNADGNYIYESTSAKPLVEGETCETEAFRWPSEESRVRAVRAPKDVPETSSPGALMVVRSGGGVGMRPDHATNAGIYWELGEIEPGEYWIGVVYAGDGEGSQYGPLSVYLNGRIVQLATQTDPVQVAPGRWFVEALAADAQQLRAGDEVGVVFRHGGLAARLILHSEEPPPEFESPWRMPRNFGGHQWNQYTALGVTAEGRFRLRDGRSAPNPRTRYNAIEQRAPSLGSLEDAAGNVNFTAWLANPLPVAVTVDYRCVVKTFYGETVARDENRLTLAPHERIERTLPFQWDAREVTHFADITVRGVDPPDLSRPREEGGAGWPEHETVTYFPRQRQLLPWPDPFNARVVRRITLDTPAGGERQIHSLDGRDWEIGYTTELEPPMPVPGDLEFDTVQVPHGWNWPRLDSMDPRPHGAYFRRTFELPSDLGGRSYRLQVDHAHSEATAYVNGRKVGNVRGEYAPLIGDITGVVQPGENELVIVVRDLIAIMNPDYVNADAPVANQDYLEAPGLHGRWGLALDSVSILSAPVISSEEVFVVTSVRNQDIATRITVANRGGSAARVRLVAEVLDDGKKVLTVGEQELMLEPNEPELVTLQSPWENPTLWEPGQPHLYAMRVTLHDAVSGETLDVGRERFGFSESWIDGPDILFNGRPIKPVGYGPRAKFHPDGNFQFIRGGGEDWLDEVGIIAYKKVSGIYNTPSLHNVENDRYWRTAETNSLATLKLWQNSPHIIAWDISNEWLKFYWGDSMPAARRFKALSDRIRSYDPTRWTLANAEGDLHGLLDNHSFHYMQPYFGPPNRFTMNGHTPFYPDEAYWRPLDRHFAPGETVRKNQLRGTLLDPANKVIMDNEFLWKSGSRWMPPGPTRVIGEDDVLSPAVDSGSGADAWLWKTKIDGHRDLGVSHTGIHQSHRSGVMRGGYLPQTIIVPENQRRGFGGTEQSRRFTVINSLFEPSDMTVTWRLTAPDGTVAQAEAFTFALKSGGIERDTFTFDLPDVQQKTMYTLRATLEADGAFACAEEWDIGVWPRHSSTAGPLRRDILLYDPAETTAVVLREMRVDYRGVDALDSLPGEPAETTLIIAEGALDRSTSGTTARLAGFVEGGGRVVILAQKATPAGLPVPTRLESRNRSSQVYLRAGSHPILKGLVPEDLKFWQPDRAVGTGTYTKPSSGSFISLVDTSFWDGLEWVQMMELYRGRGAYVLCQLPLASRFDVEPMAGELLARTIRYAAGDALYNEPVRMLLVMADPDGATAGVLNRLQVDHQIVENGQALADGSPLLLDAEVIRSVHAETRGELKRRLHNGGHVVVVNAKPEDSAWLEALAGSEIRITVPLHRLWKGRGFRRGWSRYTAGISHLDLYWKRYTTHQSDGAQAEDVENVIERFQYHSAHAEDGRELIFPGALVEVPAGDGMLLLDQRRWAPESENLRELADRNVSSLMAALEVNVSAYTPARLLPDNLGNRTVDLSELANYPLQPGEGDAEPARLDLRGFPAGGGERTFRNIPFDLTEGPNQAIALADGDAADGLPGEVVIPLGFFAEGLYFLHAAGNVGEGIVGNYHIVYQDGDSWDVPLRAGTHIADWNRPRHVSDAGIAWTGSTDRHPVVAAYRMLWVNPRPDVPIQEIVFSNPQKTSFPVLIALTATARKQTIPVDPADAARAEKLFKDGKEALDAGRIRDARRLLRSVVDLDPSVQEAYPLLADAAERIGEEHVMHDAYRLWTISGPRRPLPWNRKGEILEQQGRTQRAIEAYKTSLEIEWNQPPVLDALRRLQ